MIILHLTILQKNIKMVLNLETITAAPMICLNYHILMVYSFQKL